MRGRSLVVVVAVAGAVACGGGGGGGAPDPSADAAAFVGTWSGLLETDIGTTSVPTTASIGVTATGGAGLKLSHVCGDGVPATVDAPGHFTTSQYVCPPISSGTCSALQVTYESGVGTLSDTGLLTIQFQGTATGCGAPMTFTQAFSMGHKVGAALRLEEAAQPIPDAADEVARGLLP
jgi:hypothetical protein